LKWTEKWGEDSGEHWKVRGEALEEYWNVGVGVRGRQAFKTDKEK
jgi:hypothetical protein